MKTNFLFILFWLSIPLFTVAQNKGMPIWPAASIVNGSFHTIDWREDPPLVKEFPVTLSEDVGALGAAFDACGDLVFYVMHTGREAQNNLILYDPQGNPLIGPNSSNGYGLNGLGGRQELQVVPVPELKNEWYIIYRNWSSGQGAPFDDANYKPSFINYSRVRWTGSSILVQEKDIRLEVNGLPFTYNDGMAVSKTTFNSSNEHYLYLTRRILNNPFLSVDRFVISRSGITWEANSGTAAVGYYEITTVGSPIELDQEGNQLALVNRNYNINLVDLIVMDTREFDMSTALMIKSGKLMLVADGQPNDLSNVLPYSDRVDKIGRDVNLNLLWLSNFEKKLSQIEFSPNGRFIYMLDGGFAENNATNITYLAQIDLYASIPAVRLQVQTTPNNIYSLQEGAGCLLRDCRNSWRRLQNIQTAYNGNVYFTKQNDRTLYIIPNPDEIMPQNLIPSDIDLSDAFNPNVLAAQAASMIPDQIDGFDYRTAQSVNLDSFKVQINEVFEACDQSQRLRVESSNIDADSLVYEWLLNGVPIPGETSSLLDISSSGLYRVNVSVWSNCDPVALVFSDELNVNEISPFEISYIGAISTSCGYNNGEIHLAAQYGVPPYEYSFDNGTTFSDSGFITGLQAGFYFAVIRDARLCKVSEMVIVTDSEEMIISNIGTDPPDCGGTNGYISLTMAGNSTAIEYSMDGNNFQSGSLFNGLESGNYQLWIRDTFGCLTDTVVTLESTNPPHLEILSVLPASCGENNGIMRFKATSNQLPLSYLVDGNVVQEDYELQELAADLHKLTVTDVNGCRSEEEFVIPGIPVPVIQGITVSATSCGDDNGVLEVEADGVGLLYSIDGAFFHEPEIFENLIPGLYTVYVKDEWDCLINQLAEVEGSHVITIEKIETEEAGCNQRNGIIRILAHGNGELDFQYNSRPGSDLIEGLEEGEYEILIQDEAGCSADTLVSVTTRCPVYVPNAFTPNQDGINDEFRVYGSKSDDYLITKYQIFDRWGALIYESGNFPIRSSGYWWDGSYKGSYVDIGVYVYLIEILDEDDGTVETISGDVCILNSFR